MTTFHKRSKLAHLRLLSKSNRLWIPMITFYKRNFYWRTFKYFQKVIACEPQGLLYIVAASVYMFYVTIYIYYNYNITLTSLLFTIVMFK